VTDASALLCVVLPVLGCIVVGWLLLYDGNERSRMVRGVSHRWNSNVEP